MKYSSIWKDTYYESSASSLVYKLYLDNSLIFSGKAYRLPNGENLQINVNKICQNYLEQDIGTLLSGNTSSQRNYEAIGDFVLKDGNGNTLETYRFIDCWDYDYSWGGGAATLSVPITGEYVDGMYKLKTTVSTGNTSTQNVVTTYKNTGDYTIAMCGTPWVAYYTNCRGGWDAFVFHQGEKTDNIKQYNYSKSFNNTTYDFEDKRYISEIETIYKLSTGMLTDEQSKLFAKHLVSSNKVYLHNVKENWIKPVVITDTQVTYKEQDKVDDIVYYQITVKESQTKQRM